MIKNFTRMEHKINEKDFLFYCDIEAPLQEVKDALYKFLGIVEVVEKNALEKAKAAQVENEKKEER